MKKRNALVLAAIAIAAAALIFYFTRSEIVAVDVAAIDRGPVAETVTNTRAGTIKACERARLAPTIGGQIAQLPVKKGDRVKKGQLLLELWNQDLRAAVSLAERDAVAAVARAEQACIAAKVSRQDADRVSALIAQ